jgi:hypothetical protein
MLYGLQGMKSDSKKKRDWSHRCSIHRNRIRSLLSVYGII